MKRIHLLLLVSIVLLGCGEQRGRADLVFRGGNIYAVNTEQPVVDAVAGAHMWQSLLKSGARIVNGTDAPVEPLDPIPSFYASITRKTLSGMSEGVYEAAERMTREQALRFYTLDAAFGAFQEKVYGSLEVGKYADFTVWSRIS